MMFCFLFGAAHDLKYKMNAYSVRLLLLFLSFMITTEANLREKERDKDNFVLVHKCCEEEELMLDLQCAHVNQTDSSSWVPLFSSESGKGNVQVPGFKLIIGPPDCGAREQWKVYHVQGSTQHTDHLHLLPSGILRHYITHQDADDEEEPTEANAPRYYDYQPGTYCLDKVVVREDQLEAQFAIVCNPEIIPSWKNTDFLMRRIVNPICHGVSIICLLSIAVVYFVVPQLRDLVGNIITTIAICLIISQAADLVGIFTEFSSHVSFFVAETVMYVSILAAFFWLNSMGFYIWKTFRSRNVFLRITDGRKYCYYSSYAWTVTATMATIALFAHFMLDNSKPKTVLATGSTQQATIGWLGIAVFFTPIAFTISVNIFFYVTTAQAINRMSTYGRIHHKMKYSFEIFIKLFLVMSVAWLFLLLSWVKLNGLFYSHIVANALQGPLILYICVISQRRVTFLLRKSCCYEGCPSACCRPGDPSEGIEWGEEMMAINTSNY